MSQLKLLSQRRFGSFFWTQFLGAFNDNLFKSALVLIATYGAVESSGSSNALVPLAAGAFILPFFLFSATAGQLADRYAKTRVVRIVKLAEIAIMGLAAVGLTLHSMPLLLVALFLMGSHSAFFGPAKYGILPELLDDRELTAGNALVETGTFLAILLGTVTAGWLGATEPRTVAGAVVAVAVLGWLASLLIPNTKPGLPNLQIHKNPFTPLAQTLRATRSVRSVFLSVLGISWFWFLGATLLTALPIYCKDYLGTNETVFTFFLAIFCIGTGGGALLCERLGGKKLELGVVPIGSFGLTLTALDLFFASKPGPVGGALVGIVEFVGRQGSIRVCLDLLFLAMFGGLFTVPLYTMIQKRAAPQERSRVIAGNNILNALFMVASAGFLLGMGTLGLSSTHTFVALAVLNAAVACYIYTVIPEFLLRFVAWTLAHLLYRIRVEDIDRIPDDGPAVLVANHVTYVDWLLIASSCQRPIRFVMYHGFTKIPLVGFAFRDAKVIPIAPAKEDPDALSRAFHAIEATLKEGELVCIFPEGALTPDGAMHPFRRGIERIVERTPVPVIPLAIQGMWGSFFSRKDRGARRPFRRFWSRVLLRVGNPMPPDRVTASALAEEVARLGGWQAPTSEAVS